MKRFRFFWTFAVNTWKDTQVVAQYTLCLLSGKDTPAGNLAAGTWQCWPLSQYLPLAAAWNATPSFPSFQPPSDVSWSNHQTVCICQFLCNVDKVFGDVCSEHSTFSPAIKKLQGETVKQLLWLTACCLQILLLKIYLHVAAGLGPPLLFRYPRTLGPRIICSGTLEHGGSAKNRCTMRFCFLPIFALYFPPDRIIRFSDGFRSLFRFFRLFDLFSFSHFRIFLTFRTFRIFRFSRFRVFLIFRSFRIFAFSDFSHFWHFSNFQIFAFSCVFGFFCFFTLFRFSSFCVFEFFSFFALFGFSDFRVFVFSSLFALFGFSKFRVFEFSLIFATFRIFKFSRFRVFVYFWYFSAFRVFAFSFFFWPFQILRFSDFRVFGFSLLFGTFWIFKFSRFKIFIFFGYFSNFRIFAFSGASSGNTTFWVFAFSRFRVEPPPVTKTRRHGNPKHSIHISYIYIYIYW